ncbi:unnamed protein product, partial [Staurois parvus]
MYVKWFDTVMFYYVILVILVNVILSFSNFLPFRPRTSRRSQGTKRGRQMPASTGLHCRGHCRRDIAGVIEGSRSSSIRMVSPSVARGYRLCYTREYRQGGY